MTVISPAVPLVVGVAAIVKPPTFQPFVVLDNLSPFVLQVTIGPDQFWQDPYMSQKYPMANANNAPVDVVPVLLIGTTTAPGSSAELLATWYDSDPEGAWPISLAANAIVGSVTAIISGIVQSQGTFTEASIYFAALPANSNTGLLPCTQYCSITVSGDGTNITNATQLTFIFYDVDGNPCGTGRIFVPAGENLEAYQIPVTGVQFTIVSSAGGSTVPNLSVCGTNRIVPAFGLIAINSGVQLHSNAAVNAIGTYNLTNQNGQVAFLDNPGWATLQFTLGNAVCKGQFTLSDPTSTTITLADTSESGWHTGPSGGSALLVKTLWFPSVRMAPQFVVAVAAGAAITAAIRVISGT